MAGLVFASLLMGVGCTRAPEPTAEEARETAAKAAQATEVTAEDRAASQAAYTPEQGDWIIGRLPVEPSHLNPYTSSDAYASRVNEFIFDTLLYRNPETLEFEPHVAKSWEISDDHLIYTFVLRDDVHFSDGQPLTVEDVKFSFDTIKNPAVDAPHLRNYYKNVVSCEIVDPQTVRFTCDLPYYRHLTMLGGFELLPQHIYGTGDFNQHPNNRNPVGSGPYVLAEWQTGRQMVLDRNMDYWNPERMGHFDKRIYKIITNDNAALMELMRGDMDSMGLTPEQWVGRANTPRFAERFNRYDYYTPFYSYIGWNARRPLFSDLMVRRALTMLLDRDTILQTLYHGLGVAVSGDFFIDSPAYDQNIKPWPYDPEAAKALLQEAGWIDSDKDGLLDKDGVPFSFELLITNESPIAEQTATTYQAALRKVGIEMEIRPLEWATLLERTHTHNFDAMMLGWSMPPDPDPYQVWHSSQSEAGSNYVGYANPQADALIEQARVSFDADERNALYRQLHALIHEEQPYTFLFCSKALLALDKRIQGVIMYPFGPQALEWYVPENLQRYP
jgi:peptide/nickel transport system substrate-binding protein